MCLITDIKLGARQVASLNKTATGYYQGSYSLPTRVGVIKCSLRPRTTGKQYRQTVTEWSLNHQPVSIHRLKNILGTN